MHDKSGKPDSQDLTRRKFVIASGAALAGGAIASCLPKVKGQWSDAGQSQCQGDAAVITLEPPAAAGRVVELHSDSLTSRLSETDPLKVDLDSVSESLKKLLLLLTGKADVQQAWSVILPDLKPKEIVGIKVNTLNKGVPTHPEVVKALVDLLTASAGVKPEQIIVWDRRLDELTGAGFTESYLGCKVEGTQEKAQLKGIGRGYELQSICIGSRSAQLSQIQTRVVDHLLNVSVMKNHLASGFTGCLKNHYGTIHNPGEFHDKLDASGKVVEAHFELAIPHINAMAEVAKKARLWIMDATIAVCKGDTDSPADCVPNRLAMSLDPLALDVWGRQLRDAEAKGVVKDTVSERWMQACLRAGLGSMDVKLETAK